MVRDILLCGALCVLVPTAAHGQTALKESVGIYTFERDTVTKKNGAIILRSLGDPIANATVHNGARLNPNGMVGYCIEFNGSNQFLSLDRIFSKRELVTSFTFAAWVRPISRKHDRYIFDVRNRKTKAISHIRLFSGIDNVGFLAGGTALVRPKLGIHGEWHHLAAVWKGKARTIYIDGKPIAEKDGEYAALPLNSLAHCQPRIGSQSHQLLGPKRESRCFQGFMDEVVISFHAFEWNDISDLVKRGREKVSLSR